MQTLKIDRSRYTLSPTRDAGAFAEKLRKCTGKTKLSPIKSERRVYPKFSAGDSTAEYVHRYWVANGFSDDHRKFFAPLNTQPATLYTGEDTHELFDDAGTSAPVESAPVMAIEPAAPCEPAPVSTAPIDSPEPVTTAPDAPMDPAAVDRAPDAPIEPAPVEAWPPLQPMMRPAEHIARLPLFARLAIERIDADSDLRTGAKLDELLRAYAAQYRETCDDYTRQSAHAIASRRFWNFRPDDAPIAPAAIVPAADPAPVCEPVESPALQATRAHQWMTHAARRVYWVHCETARFSRELGPLPFGSMFRRPRSPGFMPDFLAPEIRAHRAAVAAAVRADRAAKRAPVDPAPRADAAPVDTGAAPGGWMRPATGMLSESETRAWPSAEPVESAPTPGYAFPADALPATHSDAAPVDVDTMRAQLCAVEDAILAAAPRKFSDGQYGGDIEAAARSRSVPAELKLRRKTLRAMISAARDAAADAAPVPVPVPVPGKFETFSGMSDLDLRRYIEGCHIAREFGIDFEHAAQELNDRKERGTWSNPGAPVATHSAPHPVPADTGPDDDTTPAPLDGLDVIETADAETLAEFDRLSRAPGVAPPATDARPIPSGPVLRIPAGDLRARIPARFAPAYLLTAGGAHHA